MRDIASRVGIEIRSEDGVGNAVLTIERVGRWTRLGIMGRFRSSSEFNHWPRGVATTGRKVADGAGWPAAADRYGQS